MLVFYSTATLPLDYLNWVYGHRAVGRDPMQKHLPDELRYRLKNKGIEFGVDVWMIDTKSQTAFIWIFCI